MGKVLVFYDALTPLGTSNMATALWCICYRKDKNCVYGQAFDWLRLDL